MAGGRRVGTGLGALLCALHVQAACHTRVTQELLKEGFHRDLLVKVELGEDAEGCTVAARTRLPPGIYVDPYELATLQQQNLTKSLEGDAMQNHLRDISLCLWSDQHQFCVVCCRYSHTLPGGAAAPLLSPQAVLIPDVPDVEAPEYLATALVLVLSLEVDPQCSRCFRAAVPVHARYHRPAEGSRHAPVVLESPEVLLCCCHGRLAAECWEPAEVGAPCSAENVGPCQWHSTTHRPAREELMLEVPVGLKEHSSLVCALTLLTTLLCAGLILAATCRHGHFSL